VLRNKRWTTLLATLSVFTMVAAACGGDDDDSSSGTDAVVTTDAVAGTDAAPATDAGSEETTPADTAATDDTEATDDTSATDETEPEGDAPSAPESPGEHHVTDEGDPVQGGTLVYGVDADTANAWAHYRASYTNSGYIALSAISDSLFAVNDKGENVPLLVDTVEANDDYTEWTLTMRDGIKFHDGTPLDGAAVKFNIDACRAAPLTAGALTTIGDVTADGQTVTISTAGGTPWVAFPAYFTYGSCGYMLSPKWLGSLPDVPQRQEASPVYDAALAATPADGDPAAPVGLGAFVFESYTPGNGNSFIANRNPDYWRGPNGITGEDLPYLDSIEAVVAVDIDSRSNSLRSGQFDAMQTANADAINQFLQDDAFETTSNDLYAETGYTLLNVAEGPDVDPDGSNAASPFLNLNCRKALAEAIDSQRYADERGAGLVQVANGPFPPGSIGYLEDTGYPKYDVDAAQADMETCLSELGTDSIEFSFNTTNDPFNVESNSLIISMWDEAFGDQVKATITPIEQGAYIGLALTGAFQAQGWRNHGGSDPDQQRLWWQSASVSPVGELALNFGRFSDPVIDENLEIIKTNPDPDARQEAAEAINKQFGKQVYNWWLTWTLWGIPTQPYVNGIEANVLPDGSQGVGLAYAGRHQVNQIWCDDGVCE
jgi:peptide/nickel transport system substrate-binding protein